MKVILIRHTQPTVEKGVCYGKTDLDVAASFSNEVEQIKVRLKEFELNNFQVYSSPLQRCSKLAKALFIQSFRTDKRLLELHFGHWEMKKWDEIPKGESEYWFEDWVNQPTPMGESYQDLYKRCISFWEDIKPQNIDQICVVSHAGFIRASYAYFEGINLKDSFELKLDYGEVLRLETEK